MHRIRSYQPTDLSVLQEMTAAAFDGVSIDQGMEQIFGRVAGRDWQWRKQRHIADDAERDVDGILVLESPEGRIAGFVSTAADQESGIGHIANLVVAAPCRGRGYGRELLAAALDRFRSLGLSHARIETLVQNDVGRGLYESIGFREIARQIHFAMDLK